MTRKGVTLIEVVVAVFIFFILVAGFFRAFIYTKKVDRKLESVSNVHILASNLIEQFTKFQGTGQRDGGAVTAFDTRSSFGEPFASGTHDITEISSDAQYFLQPSDYVVKPAVDAAKDISASSITYTVADYTENKQGNTYCPTSGPGSKDGFRSVNFEVKWEDQYVEG